MPGGHKNIKHSDGKDFSKENQPANRGRKSTKFLTDLLTKNLKVKKEITIDGIDVVTGKPVKVKIAMPTKEIIVQALVRQAAKGNMIAIKEIFDRTEGRVAQALEHSGKDGKDLPPMPLLFLSADKLSEDQIQEYINKNIEPSE